MSFGICSACNEFKALTAHHIRDLKGVEVNRKVMICLDCHRVYESVFRVMLLTMKLTQEDKED